MQEEKARCLHVYALLLIITTPPEKAPLRDNKTVEYFQYLINIGGPLYTLLASGIIVVSGLSNA
jgi:hypothetical protein